MTPAVMQRKVLGVPYQLLAERGFTALPRQNAELEPAEQNLSVLRALVSHPLNALDDVRGGLRFAEFEDETIPFQRGDRVYDLFAVAATNACLFTGRTDGRVHWYSGWSSDGRGPTFEAVNSNLSAFVRCSCMERAICHRMRARTVGLPARSRAASAAVAAQDEQELRDFIAAVDVAALGSALWSTVLYELAESFYQAVPGLPYLIQRGRWQVGGGAPGGD